MKKRNSGFIKKIISIALSCVILFNSVTIGVSAAESQKEQYEVYNGYGELVYTADTLEEAENYIANVQGASRASERSAAKLAFKTAVSNVGGAIMLIGYTAYAINKYYLGEIEASEIITTIISPPSLSEIIEFNRRIGVYATGSSVINPYPPNSYQAATWIRSNFYYVVMP